MVRKTLRHSSVALASALLLGLVPAGAAVAQPQAKPAAAMKNIFSGVWAMAPESSTASVNDCCAGAGKNIPLTPKYRALRDEDAYLEEKKGISQLNLTHCVSSGVPGTFLHPMFFEFLFTEGRVNIVHQDGTYRRIWTDGRSFPEDMEPSSAGYSIGHWRGNTLVVETRGLSGHSEIFMGGRTTAKPTTRVVEEINVAKDGRLHVRIITEDPEIFTQPFVRDLYYVSVPFSFETGCAADNRDTGKGEVDISLPEH